ncbi:MAG: molybdate ABC transporter permease subunit, partial [Acidimicrobiia bacterium]|nr:molybdate ABC transporter permease subunit [Acidimicrobiia bacterium]
MIGRRLPVVMVVIAALGVAFVVIPIVGLVFEVPWGELGSVLTSPIVLDAIRVSLVASVIATIIATIVGVPIATVLARIRFRGRALVRALVLLPLVIPPVVGGAALLSVFGRRGLVGEPVYEATGLVLPFSIWGVVVAVTFVSLPFMVLTVEAGLRNMDSRFEEAAASLGASPWMVLRRVTFPMVAPAITAGLVLTWARAFGEFGATITFAGNLQGRTQTMPLAVFVALESDRGAAVTISLMMVIVSVVLLVVLRDRWW